MRRTFAAATIAVASCKEYGYRRFEAISRVYLAETLVRRGNPSAAEAQLRKAIAAGINLIHINTELRVAWRHGLEEGLAKNPREVVPYKLLTTAVETVKQVAGSRLKLFNKLT